MPVDEPISVRFPADILKRAKVLAERMDRDREAGVPTVTRHQVIVRAVAKGLDALEREHGGKRRK